MAVLVALVADCEGRRGSDPDPHPRPERATPTEATPSDGRAAPGDAGASLAAAPPAAPLESAELTWSYPRTDLGPISVVVAVPARSAANERFPVLVALHGMGEAMKQPEAGARGWIDDYWLARAARRLHDPPLTEADFQGFVTDERLRALNSSLKTRPYRGLIVVCPYTPRRISDDRTSVALGQFGDFIVDEVLPRVSRETPALGTAAATGIDGVSFGGRTALWTGLRHPGAFGAVASIQAAFLPREAGVIAHAAHAARSRYPRLRLRLLSSTRDSFLAANRDLSRALDGLGVEHSMLVVPGPHDYVFNRGPGVLEMLIFHDRALRGEDL